MSRTEAIRSKLREECLAALPRWYRPWVQLLLLATVGFLAAFLSFRAVHDATWIERIAIPAAFVTSNFFEWMVHKRWMHHPRWPRRFYRAHTLHHHRLFTADDMGMKQGRELAFVLLSAPTLAIIVIASIGFALFMRWLFGSNVAWLFFATEMLYIVFAEAMHAAYHLPKSHRIRRFFWVRWLATSHVLHHDMRLMRKWNFNIGIPFADLIFRTFTIRRYPPDEPKPDP